ncbi:MAG: hypothetical protein FIB08_11850 [Candidatus Methanoperedens sp.]|nr:hypothetical protein [Candidatus Methanoperedens sp.]
MYYCGDCVTGDCSISGDGDASDQVMGLTAVNPTNKCMADMNKMLLIIIFSVIISGCTEEKTIKFNTSNADDISADSSIYREISPEGSVNLTSESITLLQDDENLSDSDFEFTLESFRGLYIRDNHNENPRPLFIWEHVPGNDSNILLDYINKRPGFQWVDNAQIIKTDELMYVWDEVPGNGSESLVKLLTDNYGISWSTDRKIEKRDDGNRIDISIQNRNISFALIDDKTRALMEIDNVRTEQFKVKQENGRINIYSDSRTIHIGGRIKISLISNQSVFLSYGDGGGIQFPVQEKNGNHIVYDVDSLQSHSISEKRYAIYNLSIKNNGSNASRFQPGKLRLIPKNGSSIPSSGDPISTYPFDDKELKDISLLPGQITRGYAAFKVDSMINRSFLLIYGSKPVTLKSFENCVLALEKADLFDYSNAMGKPPYNVRDYGLSDTYEPPQPEFYTDRGLAYSQIWSNWANRSVVEFFKKLDLKELNNIKTDDDLPSTYSIYTLKVIPEKNVSIHPGNPVVITDENNEELINAYYSEISISDNTTFRHSYNNFTDVINYSNATLVRVFFANDYGWSMATRFSRNDQFVILDESRKIVMIGFQYRHFVS